MGASDNLGMTLKGSFYLVKGPWKIILLDEIIYKKICVLYSLMSHSWLSLEMNSEYVMSWFYSNDFLKFLKW